MDMQSMEQQTARARAVNAAWREKNRERIRRYMRAWYRNNKDRYKEYDRRWKAKDPEGARASARRAGERFRALHPERTRESWQRYQKRHPAERREQVLRHREKYPARHLLRYTRTRALRTNREFSLTEQWIESRLPGGCELSGLQFDLTRVVARARRIRGPSIDRIDNSKGYTPDNCRLICVGINLGMQEFGFEQTAALWRAVLERR